MSIDRDHEIREAVGAVIRDTRKSRGLTLKQLASLADLDWSQLAKVERGLSRVSDATLERIGRELGFTLPALYASALARSTPGGKKPGQRGNRSAARRSAARLIRGFASDMPGQPSNRS